MTDERIGQEQAIRDRLRLATQGPWVYEQLFLSSTDAAAGEPPDAHIVVASAGENSTARITVANVLSSTARGDGPLIANAPSDLTYLLDRLEAVEGERDAARYQLHRWLDWCFDESGTHARPDKWTRELLEGRPLTGADVNDAIRTKDARIAMQANEIEDLETSRDALLTAAAALFRAPNGPQYIEAFDRLGEVVAVTEALVPSELAPSQEHDRE